MKPVNYAKALHQIAVEKNRLDLITHQFDTFKDEMEKHSSWLKMMDSPMLTIEQKYQYINQLAYDTSFLSMLKSAHFFSRTSSRSSR